MFHDCSDHATVGNDAGIFLDFRKGLHYPCSHLHTAFALRWDVGFVITSKPRLVLRRVFQLIVAMHFKNAEVHFPEAGIGFVWHIPKKDLQSFVRPFHIAGKETDTLNVIMYAPQFFFACIGQGQVGTAAVEVLFVGLGLSVANQIDGHFNRCSNPQKIRLTCVASLLKY